MSRALRYGWLSCLPTRPPHLADMLMAHFVHDALAAGDGAIVEDIALGKVVTERIGQGQSSGLVLKLLHGVKRWSVAQWTVGRELGCNVEVMERATWETDALFVARGCVPCEYRHFAPPMLARRIVWRSARRVLLRRCSRLQRFAPLTVSEVPLH